MYVFTARIRRMGESTVFSLFVSPHLDGGRGYPITGLDRGVPHHRSGQGGTPSQIWVGGTPARSGCWVGGTPARSGWWVGVPWPGLDLGGGTPARSGWWGVPRYPSAKSGCWGVPPQPGLDGGGTPPPGQVWMVWGYPSQVWMVEGYLGYPPGQVWMVGDYPG